jgi:hypothetical protein
VVAELSQAAFLLLATRQDATEMARRLAQAEGVVWASAAYGPHCVVGYAEAASPNKLAAFVERIRTSDGVDMLDARVCKPIPGDEGLPPLELSEPEVAMLLINVDYALAKEREVAYRLRENARVRLVRAMWGPADIIAVLEAPDHETMRNVICDEVKVLRGVASNTTLYCYPQP